MLSLPLSEGLMVLEEELTERNLNPTLTHGIAMGAGGGWGRCTWSQPYTFAAGSAVHSTAAS